NLIGDAERGGVSLIPRARGPVLQLDDCDINTAILLDPFAFLTVETSRANYQCWLAFNDNADKDAVRNRLFKGLRDLLPGSKVNHGAGGATRWPGSINFKPERDGFRVRVHSANPGRIMTPSELEEAGLLADPPPETELQAIPDSPRGNWWPDWKRCLADKEAQAKNENIKRESHRSEADAAFACLSLRYGHSEQAIAAKLLEVSERAKQSGPDYAERTVREVKAWMKGKSANAAAM